ncbi:MAG TPA: polysaccharide biosynthesis tyrosine autokinase [Sphingopyxis sp.]|uniref:GumC family protein n=1 Tax=Sphingopyxis sp. TaxID=1908224 RepID=UPI002E2EEAEA|nr:polysaccharide biosynthesis tyrosine autokinase [Sphingopyxis sp.]HEX2812373.1 polysaccharide biosynthesis tyrosine autokinase [Sphingopyxis sp.]
MNQLISNNGSMTPGLPAPVDESFAGERQPSLSILEQIWMAIVNHRNLAAGAVLGMVLLGLIVTFLSTPQYRSTTRLEILPDAPVATSVEGQRDKALINEISFYNTQYSLLRSEALAERVLRAGNLLADKDFISSFKLDNADASMTSVERRNLNSDAVTALLDRLSVSPVRNSSLVDVSFATPSAQLSAKLANLWAQQFQQVSIDRRFAATSDARKYLEARLQTLRQNLETSERSLINYGMSKGIVTISSQSDADGRTRSQTLVASDIAAVSTALSKAREERIAAEAQLGNTQTGIAAVNAPTIGSLRQRRAELQAELAQQRTIFADDYPAVVSLRAQLANLDRSIAAEVARSSQGNREAYQAALKRQRDLQGELDDLTQRYNKQQRESIEMAILQREVDSNRQLYEGLLQRYKEIGAAGVGTNNISVVDAAKIADRPSSPRLIVNVALALFAGIALAAGLIFAQEKIDSSIRDPQEVNARFGLPLLGAVPEVAGHPAELIIDKKSEIYEAYFALMTNLSFLTAHGAPRSIMLTSSQPREGKSNSSLCLATVMAATGKSVILIDADVRNPSQNEYLHIPNKLGLSHYLAGDDDYDAMIAEMPKYGFSIMTAGKVPPNAAELLGSQRLDHLIAALLTRYDHVLIDSPPLLGLADAPLIARRVEGVLFTIEANATKRRAIANALMRLRMAGVKIFGAIVTKVGARNQVYGYGYGYGYGFKYGDEEPKG